MNNQNKIFLVLGIVIGVTIVAIYSFQPSKNTPTDSSYSENKIEETPKPHLEDKFVPFPVEIDFAGEKVPLDNIDVEEKLDRELIVNTYWHSQTILFHKRAHRWFPVIEPILKSENVPDDFKYLALIESGLDNVVSPAGARGFWQFMKSTAKSYNLEVNGDIDERYHVEKATVAACKYLKKAKNKFGSWTLAAASYNMGIAGLSNRLEEQKCSNYYDLLLNAETGRYIYRMLAAKQILTNSSSYGFEFNENDLYQPYNYTIVSIDSSISDLTSFAINQGTNYKILKLLNPWLRSNQLPNPENKVYEIKISNDIHPIEPYNE